MRRFWLAAVLGFVLATIAWTAGLRAQIGVPTASSRWVFEVYDKKTRIAAATPSPRVLIVAGSGALFGLDSAALSAAWHRPVVNMAVNAGLGLRYILWRARQTARAGDVILLPLEYALFVDDDRPNAQIVDYALARDTAYWHDLSSWRAAWFAAALAPDRWWRGLRRLDDPPITGGLYGGYHIDASGDQIHTAPSDRTPQEAAEVAASRVWDYGARARYATGGWPELAAFAEWARAARICLIAVPPALLTQSPYAGDPVERAFFDGLPARMRDLGIAYLGQPRDFMYPATWFFNTDYHLQDWARREHTTRILAIPGLSPDTLCTQP
jgi:hypothetical protein